MKPCSPTKPKEKLMLLEVPPVNIEPGRRHLNCEEMEEIGKLSRERRRLEKIKDSPIEWKEKCRLVRSGDAPVDEHCLPSTIEGDMGALVDKCRRNAVVDYLNCSKLCKQRNICVTEKALQRGKAKSKGRTNVNVLSLTCSCLFPRRRSMMHVQAGALLMEN
ncbi:EF-hand calcium-binding domain-containing protein 12-like, partial [Oxyura jamaicensis]|uniref:EF-hand calcium-binding domain-containing protein 12-like n=1 Tax=Oxyura jamaicensis TaxID=8884 RepID=UPI0015A6A341